MLENTRGARKCYKSPKFLMYFVLKHGISDLFFSLRHFIERIFNRSSQQPQPTTCRTTPSSGYQLMCQPLVPELLPAALVHPFLPFRELARELGQRTRQGRWIGAQLRMSLGEVTSLVIWDHRKRPGVTQAVLTPGQQAVVAELCGRQAERKPITYKPGNKRFGRTHTLTVLT